MSLADSITLRTSRSVISLGLSDMCTEPRLLNVLICTPDIFDMTFLILHLVCASSFDTVSSMASDSKLRFETMPFVNPFVGDCVNPRIFSLISRSESFLSLKGRHVHLTANALIEEEPMSNPQTISECILSYLELKDTTENTEKIYSFVFE